MKKETEEYVDYVKRVLTCKDLLPDPAPEIVSELCDKILSLEKDKEQLKRQIKSLTKQIEEMTDV